MNIFMMKRIPVITIVLLAAIMTGCNTPTRKQAASDNDKGDLLIIDAPELINLNFDLTTGGLPVVPGLETYTVIRSDREHPENAEGYGYTYQHHPDIAVWKGRLYAGWNSCEVDEDTWPSRELLSSSADGKTWTKPVEMFPQGTSTPLRMYFYLATNGRMIIIAGLRINQEKLSERRKNAFVVRELKPDHSLGEVFTLRPPAEEVPNKPPGYKTSEDKNFVKACDQLLSDHLFLLQQDYGNLLDPENRMKWNDPQNWEGDSLLKRSADNFGKAMCFFERKDGAIVGIGKNRWVTVSNDKGITWTQPEKPGTFISGMGKVWGQRINDGRYILIYNPDPSRRWPLAILTSEDGLTFRNPYAIHNELPARRYAGLHKDAGASYHRGLSKWNNDGTFKDDAVWMIYSLNKEEIRVVRIRVPE